MLTRNKKVGSNSGVVKLENRLLRLFRPNDAFQGSPNSLSSTDREDVYVEDQRIIGKTMIEAEYQRAKALLAFQQHQRFR